MTGQVLPPEAQDKRGEAHIEPENWLNWLRGNNDEAKLMLVAPPADFYDQTDAASTDALLQASSNAGQADMLLSLPGEP